MNRARRRRLGIRRRRWVTYCERLGGTHVTKRWTPDDEVMFDWEAWWVDAWQSGEVRLVIEADLGAFAEELRAALPEGYTVALDTRPLLDFSKPCPYDTNGDGDCGRLLCPFCGEPGIG